MYILCVMTRAALLLMSVPVLSVVSIWYAGSGFEQAVQSETEVTPFRSMLVQEGDPPMGRPVILSKEATLLPEPPSASWGSAGGVTPALQPSSVPAADMTGVTSQSPFDIPTQVDTQVCLSTAAGV